MLIVTYTNCVNKFTFYITTKYNLLVNIIFWGAKTKMIESYYSTYDRIHIVPKKKSEKLKFPDTKEFNDWFIKHNIEYANELKQ